MSLNISLFPALETAMQHQYLKLCSTDVFLKRHATELRISTDYRAERRNMIGVSL
jgi:hypothetical protein